MPNRFASMKNMISLSKACVEFVVRFRHSTSLNVHVAVVIIVLLLVCAISLNYSLFVAGFTQY